MVCRDSENITTFSGLKAVVTDHGIYAVRGGGNVFVFHKAVDLFVPMRLCVVRVLIGHLACVW